MLLILTALSFGSIASTSSALAGPGDLDPDFGVGGKVTTDFTGLAGEDNEDEATAVLEVEDDKIVVVGFVFNPDNDTFDFALARYDEDGTLDPTFGPGGNGKVTTDFAAGTTNDFANDAAVDDDGKIIVVGSSEGPDENVFVFALARYNSDGSLDTTFGTGGLVTTSFPDSTFSEAEAVAVEEGYDKIVVAGAAGEELIEVIDPDDGSVSLEIVQPDFALARYNEDGSLDLTFDVDGLVTTDFSGVDESFDEAAAVAIDDDDYRIIAAGFSQADEDASEDFALARYNEDGSLDTTFGVGGLVTTDFDGDFDVIEAIALQDGEDDLWDYKIVAAGITVVGPFDPETEENDTEEDFALARYNEDGSLDLGFGTFGGGGKVVTDFQEGFDLATDVAIMEDEYKIVVVGLSAVPEDVDPDEEEDFALARYNEDGSLDTTFGVGGDGKVLTDFAGENDGAAAVVIEDDKIIVAGSTFDPATTADDTAGTGEDFAIAVYEAE